MSGNGDRHQYFLNELCLFENLRQIDEDPTEIVAIFKEPEWWNCGRVQKTPDIFIFHLDGSVSVVELKGSKKKKTKAVVQIRNGKKMIHELFGVPRNKIVGKFVTYHQRRGYHWELIRGDAN